MKKPDNYRKLFSDLSREWKWLFRYISRYKFTLLLYILIGLAATGMSLAASVMSKYLIDAVVGHSRDKLPVYASMVVGLALMQILFQAMSSWMTAKLGTRAQNEIRLDIFDHVVSSEWEDIGGYHSGDLINRLEGDVSSVFSGVVGFVPSVFTRSLQFFGSLAIVLYYDKVMALLALMSAPFMFFSSRFLLKTIRKFNKKARDLNGKILSYSEESVQNLQIIKAFDLTKQYIKSFGELLGTYRELKLSYEKFSIVLTMCLSVLGLIVSYSCYGWSVYRLWQGKISFGTMTLFLQISGYLTSSFGSLASLAPTAVTIATSAGRIMEVTHFPTEEDKDREKAERIKKKAIDQQLCLHADNITFAYKGTDSKVISGGSFEIKSGETVALVGPSGEGKTTVLRLILGLVKPTNGRIYLSVSDGEEIDISDSTRRLCSYVPQGVNLFSGTIADNLRLVKPDASEEEMYEVLRQADIADFIKGLPNGLGSPVGEGGANLSQGQQQRIAIARALLRDAEILIMDEATSALDSETEDRVLNNIMKTTPNRICVITTHRQSMLKYCDRVYRVDAEGKICLC